MRANEKPRRRQRRREGIRELVIAVLALVGVPILAAYGMRVDRDAYVLTAMLLTSGGLAGLVHAATFDHHGQAPERALRPAEHAGAVRRTAPPHRRPAPLDDGVVRLRLTEEQTSVVLGHLERAAPTRDTAAGADRSAPGGSGHPERRSRLAWDDLDEAGVGAIEAHREVVAKHERDAGASFALLRVCRLATLTAHRRAEDPVARRR